MDAAGAVVPGAKVEARNSATGVVFSGISNNSGNYSILDLPAGTYTVTAAVLGFKTYTQTDLNLVAAARLRDNIVLQAGPAAESVTVTAESALLKTESGNPANARASDLSALPPLTSGAVGGVPPIAGAGGGGRGGRAAGVIGTLNAPRAAARAPAPSFAFDYSVTPQGALRIVPSAAGFLAVTASNTAGTSTAVVTGRQLQAGATAEIPLPSDATQVIVIFSAQANPPAFAGEAPGGISPPSGAKSAPNPSANSVIYAVIRVRP